MRSDIVVMGLEIVAQMLNLYNYCPNPYCREIFPLSLYSKFGLPKVNGLRGNDKGSPYERKNLDNHSKTNVVAFAIYITFKTKLRTTTVCAVAPCPTTQQTEAIGIYIYLTPRFIAIIF